MSGQSKGIPQRQIGRGRDWSPLVSRFWDWDVKVGNGLGHRQRNPVPVMKGDEAEVSKDSLPVKIIREAEEIGVRRKVYSVSDEDHLRHAFDITPILIRPTNLLG